MPRDPRRDPVLIEGLLLLAIALAVIVVVLAAHRASAASPPDTRTTPTLPEPPPSLLRCVGAHSLGVGAPAPCSGLLVPEAQALEAAHCVGVGLPSCRVDLVLCRDTSAVERRTCLAVQAADQAEVAALRQALADARRPPERPWYEHPAVVGVAAGVVGAGLGVLVTWAATR